MTQFYLSIRGFLLAIAVTAMLLLAAGCGSSDDSADGTTVAADITVETGSLSKAQFIQEAGEACKNKRAKFTRELTSFLKLAGKKTAKINASNEERIGREIQTSMVQTIFLPNYEQLVSELTELGAPSGDEEQVTAFVQAMQQTVDTARSEPTEVLKQLTPFEQAIKLATAYGLTVCAENL